MDPNTPGVQTSEFKVTAIATLVSLIAGVIALIHPGFHLDQATQAFIVSTAIGAITLIGSVYTFCRSHLKAAAIEANASVKSSQAYAAQPITGGDTVKSNSDGGQF